MYSTVINLNWKSKVLWGKGRLLKKKEVKKFKIQNKQIKANNSNFQMIYLKQNFLTLMTKNCVK